MGLGLKRFLIWVSYGPKEFGSGMERGKNVEFGACGSGLGAYCCSGGVAEWITIIIPRKCLIN